MTDIQKIISHLYADPRQNVYVILDAARDKAIYPALMDANIDHHCLYAGTLSKDLRAAAPYLVQLKKDHPFMPWLIGRAWGNSWGIFLQTPSDLEAMRRHFRRFLKVRDHQGKILYFRYYDPRVLRVFLPTCDYDQLLRMFGTVSHYIVESEDANTLVEYSLKEMNLEWRFVYLKIGDTPPVKKKNG